MGHDLGALRRASQAESEVAAIIPATVGRSLRV